MFKRSIRFLLLGFLSSFSPAEALTQKVVQANGLDFWTESFGNPKDPTILLIMGYARPGLMWPQAFCEQLSSRGYFVIRYDSRDTGLSSPIDYKKHPYSFIDMSKDAISILDSYKISKAHIVAYSQGCPITLITGAYYPERVSSMTLISGSLDFRPCLDAIDGKAHKHQLSPCSPVYVSWANSFATNKPNNQQELVERIVQGESILNGTSVPFDEALYHQLALQNVVSTKSANGSINHRKATDASFPLYHQAAAQVRAPTLIIQGTHDVVFPVDHGAYMKSKIPNAELIVIQNMGHILNAAFYKGVIDHIVNLTQKAQY